MKKCTTVVGLFVINFFIAVISLAFLNRFHCIESFRQGFFYPEPIMSLSFLC